MSVCTCCSREMGPLGLDVCPDCQEQQQLEIDQQLQEEEADEYDRRQRAEKEHE